MLQMSGCFCSDLHLCHRHHICLLNLHSELLVIVFSSLLSCQPTYLLRVCSVLAGPWASDQPFVARPLGQRDTDARQTDSRALSGVRSHCTTVGVIKTHVTDRAVTVTSIWTFLGPNIRLWGAVSVTKVILTEYLRVWSCDFCRSETRGWPV
jgi:hypothetical protein